MNTFYRISGQLAGMAGEARYVAGMERHAEKLDKAAQEVSDASDSTITAADDIMVAAQNISNLAALAFALRDDDYSQDIYRRITEQISQLQSLALTIQRGTLK